jgi:hypothetical protein
MLHVALKQVIGRVCLARFGFRPFLEDSRRRFLLPFKPFDSHTLPPSLLT